MSNDKMREAFEALIRRVEKLAFETKAPNTVTPRLMEACVAARSALTQQPESEPDGYTADNLAEEVCDRLETILGRGIDGDGSPYSIAIDSVDFLVRAIKDSGLQFDDEDNTFRQQPESDPIGEIGLDPNGILEPQIYSDFDITTLEVGAEIYTSPQPSAQVPDSDAQKLCDWLYRVGYVNREKEQDYDPRGRVAWQACYDAIAAAPSAAQVPEGWKPVPEECTEEMIDAACAANFGPDPIAPADAYRVAYRAMLTAAPSIAEKREPSALQIDDALELVRLLEAGALNDCVDNDGVVYASEWLHEAIHGLNRYIQEARRPEPPEVSE